MDKIDRIAEFGNTHELYDAVRLSYEKAFAQALMAQALNRLQIRELDAAAKAELQDLFRRSGEGARIRAAAGASAEPAAPVVPVAAILSPIDQCVHAWQTSMDGKGMDAFKKKWIDNETNKRVWEQAYAEGKI
jgi:hypothetical protein